jgi:hypothetical protein
LNLKLAGNGDSENLQTVPYGRFGMGSAVELPHRFRVVEVGAPEPTGGVQFTVIGNCVWLATPAGSGETLFATASEQASVFVTITVFVPAVMDMFGGVIVVDQDAAIGSDTAPPCCVPHSAPAGTAGDAVSVTAQVSPRACVTWVVSAAPVTLPPLFGKPLVAPTARFRLPDAGESGWQVTFTENVIAGRVRGNSVSLTTLLITSRAVLLSHFSVLVIVTVYVAPTVVMITGCEGEIVVVQKGTSSVLSHASMAEFGTAGSIPSVTVQLSKIGTRSGAVGLLTDPWFGKFGSPGTGRFTGVRKGGPLQATFAVNAVAGKLIVRAVSLTTVLITSSLAVTMSVYVTTVSPVPIVTRALPVARLVVTN